jgi:UDP-N-acetylmuramate: L-alanyl-gamma-D-glutamyl-meso-diaminopimelate ligase
MIGYKTPKHKIVSGITYIKDYKLKIFGNHNLQNLNAAKLVCRELGITSIDFYNKIQTFAGASNRLELIKENKESAIYKDFAHSPSKLKATIHAMKKQFKNRKLIACMELHTFSSLNKGFINEYNNSMKLADQAIVFISDKAIKHKKLDPISEHKIKVAFNQSNITIVKDAIKLSIIINKIEMKKANLLMMSSGNFENLDYDKINL